MHLTNYSLNKKNWDYDFNNDGNFFSGSKRTFTSVMKYLKNRGKNTEKILKEIKQLIKMLLVSLHPFLIFSFDCQFKEPSKA